MAYTETTQTSFFSRLGNSFSGIGMGIALFVAGTALLWWNEGDFVATRDALNETQAQTQIVGSADNLGPSFSGKVVHVTGYADTKQVLNDNEITFVPPEQTRTRDEQDKAHAHAGKGAAELREKADVCGFRVGHEIPPMGITV